MTLPPLAMSGAGGEVGQRKRVFAVCLKVWTAVVRRLRMRAGYGLLARSWNKSFWRGSMAIESAAYFRRLARVGLLVLIGTLSLCGVAKAQSQSVTAGSVIPLQHSTNWCQVYHFVTAPNGDTLLLDVCGGGGYGSIYQLKKGSTTFQTVAAAIDTAGTYWNEGLAMDAKGTFY